MDYISMDYVEHVCPCVGTSAICVFTSVLFVFTVISYTLMFQLLCSWSRTHAINFRSQNWAANQLNMVMEIFCSTSSEDWIHYSIIAVVGVHKEV